MTAARLLALGLALSIPLAAGCAGDPTPSETVTVEGVDPPQSDGDLQPDAGLAPGGEVAPDPSLAPGPNLEPVETLRAGSTEVVP